MPGAADISRGNVGLQTVLQESLTPPNVAANATVLQTYTINGVLVNDMLEFNQLSHVAGLLVGNMWVSAANTISVQFVNTTTSPINSTPAQSFLIMVTRGNPILAAGGYSFPTAIV
jgi:hypothetical protein